MTMEIGRLIGTPEKRGGKNHSPDRKKDSSIKRYVKTHYCLTVLESPQEFFRRNFQKR
jgi:hypothetical protein